MADPQESLRSSEPDPLVGTTLRGLYRIERRIGEGGMGNVYAAEHVHLGKRFAVKVLSPSISSSRASVDRLKAEAVAASRIDHDNIVEVVNFDATEDGLVFIVMELLDGESLAVRVARGALPVVDAIRLILPVVDALAVAHDHGIVHRDLKPENIFLAQKGSRHAPKVLDFGISKIKSDDAEQVRLTRTGQLVGTPLYMSPEQAKGEPNIDPRADIYSLGVILYELVTGSTPFQGTNYFQLLWKHGNEAPPSIAERAPATTAPASFEALVMRMLAKAPDDRPQTMAEVRAALLGCLADLGVPADTSSDPDGVRAGTVAEAPPPARQAPPTGMAARPKAAAIVAAILACALGAWFLMRGEAVTPAAVGADGPPRAKPAPSETAPTEPSTAKATDIAPVTVAVRFVSDPPGARVTVNNEELPDPTPAVAELPISGDPLEVGFTRRGYRKLTRTITITSDIAPVEVKLLPREASRPSADIHVRQTY